MKILSRKMLLVVVALAVAAAAFGSMATQNSENTDDSGAVVSADEASIWQVCNHLRVGCSQCGNLATGG